MSLVDGVDKLLDFPPIGFQCGRLFMQTHVSVDVEILDLVRRVARRLPVSARLETRILAFTEYVCFQPLLLLWRRALEDGMPNVDLSGDEFFADAVVNDHEETLR
jgi:hypothetical protein